MAARGKGAAFAVAVAVARTLDPAATGTEMITDRTKMSTRTPTIVLGEACAGHAELTRALAGPRSGRHGHGHPRCLHHSVHLNLERFSELCRWWPGAYIYIYIFSSAAGSGD